MLTNSLLCEIEPLDGHVVYSFSKANSKKQRGTKRARNQRLHACYCFVALIFVFENGGPALSLIKIGIRFMSERQIKHWHKRIKWLIFKL